VDRCQPAFEIVALTECLRSVARKRFVIGGLRALLHALDVPSAAIDREIGEMQFLMYGKASNRRVLSSMTQLAWDLSFHLDEGSDATALAVKLSGTPMRALAGAGKWKDFGVPKDVAVELLTGRQSGPAGAH